MRWSCCGVGSVAHIKRGVQYGSWSDGILASSIQAHSLPRRFVRARLINNKI